MTTNFIFLAPKLLKMMPKFVPPEILMTILGFLPQMDLNNDMLVSKAWHNLIKGAGKQLPQHQEIDIDTIDIRNNILMVDFSIDGKTVRLTEGKAYNTRRFAQDNILVVGGRKDVEFLGLKNCIVESHIFYIIIGMGKSVIAHVKNRNFGKKIWITRSY